MEIEGGFFKMRVLTIANQKGGVGKSATAQALAESLVKHHNKKVLLIDADPEGNLSQATGVENPAYALFDINRGKIDTHEAIMEIADNHYFIASDYDTINVRAGVFSKLINDIKEDNFDYVIIDTSPALGVAGIDALRESDYLLIPTCADGLGLKALKDILSTLSEVQESNKKLKNAGIIITRYNPRTVLNSSVMESIKKVADKEKSFVYRSVVKNCIAVSEAQTMQRGLFEYDSKSTAAEAYKDIVNEFLERIDV